MIKIFDSILVLTKVRIMGWNNFEVSCGFGGGEETTRFGPRQESGSSLYQIDTVACVKNNDNVRDLFKNLVHFSLYRGLFLLQYNNMKASISHNVS